MRIKRDGQRKEKHQSYFITTPLERDEKGDVAPYSLCDRGWGAGGWSGHEGCGMVSRPEQGMRSGGAELLTPVTA